MWLLQPPLNAGFLNLWATEEFLTGHGLVLLKLSAFYKLNLQISGFQHFYTATH